MSHFQRRSHSAPIRLQYHPLRVCWGVTIFCMPTSEDEWARLLHHCKQYGVQLQICIADHVQLPAAIQAQAFPKTLKSTEQEAGTP